MLKQSCLGVVPTDRSKILLSRYRRGAAVAIALTPFAGILASSVQGANSQYNVINGMTDLTVAGTYTAGGILGTGVGGTPAGTGPTVTSDVTFNSGVVYNPAAFTLNSSQTFGSLNDLSTTAISISNTSTSGTGDILTLGGGGDPGSSGPGTAPGDLLFVNTGSTLTLNGGTGVTALGVALGQSGNFDVAGTATISSLISDGGLAFGITKTGAGTLTLGGADTYTGTTTINSGTLAVSATGSLASGDNVTFAGNGSLNVTGQTGGSTQTLGTLLSTVGDNTVTSTFGTVGTTLAITTYTRSAGATTNFIVTNGANPSTNKITLGNVTANTFISPGTFFGGSSYAFYDAGGFVRALNYSTDATAANASTSTGSETALPGTLSSISNVQYAGSAGTTTTATAASTSTSLAVSNGSVFAVGETINDTTKSSGAVYVTAISGNTLTLSGSLTVASGDTITPLNSVTTQGTAAVNTLNLSGVGANVTLASGATLTTNGILRSGGTAISPSFITGGTSVTAGGTNDLVIDTSLSTDVLTIATPVNNSGVPLVKSGAGTLSLNGVVSGAGSVTVNSGTININAANTYSGGTFLYGGTIGSLGNAAALGTGRLTVGAPGSGAATTIDIGSSLTYSNPITVNAGGVRYVFTAGNPTFTFSGPITLNGNANFSVGSGGGGNTETVSGGITGTGNFISGSPAGNGRTSNVVLSTNAVNMTGYLANNTAATIANGGFGYGSDSASGSTTTVSAQIGSNVTELFQNSANNTFILTGASNPFYGDSIVSAGTLNLRNSTTLQNSVVNLTGGALKFGTSTTVGLPAVMLGGLAGTGNVNLNDTLTTPAAITLTLGNSNVINNSSTNPNTLNPIYSGVLSNTTTAGASVTKVGTDTQTFAGLNTYTGFTNISGGTLAAGIAGTASSGPFGVNTPVYIANAANTNLNLQTYSNQIASLSGGGSTGGNVQIGSGATLTIAGASIIKSFGGSISGLGGLTLNPTGTSTQTLTGANTYSGPTTVSAGTLGVTGTGQLLGDTAINVASGAAFTAQPGTGTLSVGISNASLNLNAGSRFSMQDGAVGKVTLNGAASTNVLTLGGTSGSPTNLTFELSSSGTADELVVPNGNIAYAGSPVNDISLVKVGTGAPSTLTNIPLIYAPNSSSGIVLSDFALSTAAVSLNGVSYTTSLSTENGSAGDYLFLNLTAAASASSYFTGAGGNGSWATANNFATDHTGATPQASIPTAANVILTADSANNFQNQTLDGNYTVNSLTFTGTNTPVATNGITLSSGNGGTLTLNAGSGFSVTSGSSSPVTSAYGAGIGIEVQPGSSSNTINAPVVLGASQTWENDSAAGVLTVNGSISDGGLNYSLTKTGVGMLVLGGVNSYAGGTFVTGGTLQIASGQPSALPASGTLTVNGGTFDLNANSLTLPALSDGGVSTGTITSSSGPSTLTFGIANASSFSGVITGPITLNSSGGATITLSGSNSYTGPTTVSAGTLVAASNSALGSSSALTAGLVLSGSATANFTSASPAIASLTGLSANSVVLGNSATSTATQLTVGGNGSTTTFAGVISDLHASNAAAVGSLNVAGGTLVLTSANTYTGTTTIASGATLQLGSGGATGGLAAAGGAITDNGTLTLNRTAGLTQGTDFTSSPIGGAGSIVINQGQLTLNEPNTYSGGSFVNAGNLSLGGNATTIFPTDAGTGPIYLGANGSSVVASIVSGGGAFLVNYANPIFVEPGGNRYTYTGGIPNPTYSGLVTLVGGATLGFGINGNSTVSLTGGVVGTGNLEIGNPLTGRTATFNISGGAINPVGTVSDYITYGAQLQAGSAVNISANIGSNVTGLIQNALNATMTLSGSNSYIGGTSVSAGKLVLASAGAFPSNGSAGTALTISTGSTVLIGNYKTLGATSPFVPIVSSLSNSGTIDLTNNALILKNASASIGTIYTQIQQAYANGAWTGNSSSGIITSTLAQSDTTHLTAVGFATGITTFENQTVGTGDILVKFTYYGDANLDGKVDGSDYSRIDNGYLQQLTGWYNGDFNYDGVVDGSDYTLIDNAFNMQGTAFAAVVATPTAQIAGSSATSAVPEPTTLGLLGLGAMGLLGRRTRRRR